MLYEKEYKFITENGLIPDGKRVIAGVSGGADSVCLLDILFNLRERLGITLECAHFNHNLRDDESDGDEEYVRTLCKKYGIPFHRGEADVMSMTADGTSIEDAARKARYAFFSEISDENTLIATAHNQNDNTETFFINLLRGSGSRGLCGIPQRRGNIVRPLLNVTRAEILEHLQGAGLKYRTDSTNSDTAYLRNFIRNDIIPRFNARGDVDINKSVARAIANLKAENDALDRIARSADSDNADTLSKLSDAVLYRVLTAKLECAYGIILDSAHFKAVKALLLQNNGREQIRDGIFAVVGYGRFCFTRLAEKKDKASKLNDGENIFAGRRILINNIKEIYTQLTNTDIDCDKISDRLYARTRRDGDTFVCQHRKCTGKLKKLLINDKMSRDERDRLIVICDGAGNTVYVEGYGADARVAARKGDKNVKRIEII